MNIIFKKNLTVIDQKYTVLDLDTFSLPDGSEHTACCIIENIPIDELPATENLKDGKTSPLKLGVVQTWTKEGKDWKLIGRQAVKLPLQ